MFTRVFIFCALFLSWIMNCDPGAIQAYTEYINIDLFFEKPFFDKSVNLFWYFLLFPCISGLYPKIKSIIYSRHKC